MYAIWTHPRMMTIHIMQSGLRYVIDTMNFSDEATLIIYLRARSVTHENMTKALEGFVRDGAYTIEQD